MVQLPIVLGFHSCAIESVDHDALWLDLANEFRRVGAHMPKCSVSEYGGYIRRNLLSTVHIKKVKWQVVRRDVRSRSDRHGAEIRKHSAASCRFHLSVIEDVKA